jgi:hypothetical protein
MANATENAVCSQIESMGAAVFEIGVLIPGREAGDNRTDAVMLLRTWEKETIQRSIPWLRAKNAAGAAIYVRPHGEHHLSLVDDLNLDAVRRMKMSGFEPTLVVETSPSNSQAWLNHGTALDKKTSTAAAKTLADPGAADWRHFGRLAGFVNRKRQYAKPDGLFPFVRIAECRMNFVYTEAGHFVSDLQKRLVDEEARPARQHRMSRLERHDAGSLKTIDDFREDGHYAGDGNRIDLAYAVYGLAHGVDEAAIRSAIESRDLAKKGSEARQEAYVKRTISKALQRVNESRGR